jgi:type I restriction enzyme M protein
MQDDMYQIAEDGWKGVPYPIIERNKKTGKETNKGWSCDLIPPGLMVEQFFGKEKDEMDALVSERENVESRISELEEEHGGEEGFFADFEKVNKGSVSKRLKELGNRRDAKEEIAVLREYLDLTEQSSELKDNIKKAEMDLDKACLAQYKKLSTDDVKRIVVDGKWMSSMNRAIHGEMDRISQRLTGRIKELMERYDTPLPEIEKELEELTSKVNAHLNKMGYVW